MDRCVIYNTVKSYYSMNITVHAYLICIYQYIIFKYLHNIMKPEYFMLPHPIIYTSFEHRLHRKNGTTAAQTWLKHPSRKCQNITQLIWCGISGHRPFFSGSYSGAAIAWNFFIHRGNRRATQAHHFIDKFWSS